MAARREYENHRVLPMIQEASAIASIIEEKAALLSQRPSNVFRIMAIDPGLANCAVAIIEIAGGQETVKTTKIAPPEQFKNKPFLQAMYVQRIIEQLIVDNAPTFVAKEGPAYNAPQTAHDLGRVHQAIETACWNTGRFLVVVAPTSALSCIGARKKDETRQLVYKKYHIEFPTADECDAYNIGKTAQEMLNGTYPRPKPKKTPRKKAA